MDSYRERSRSRSPYSRTRDARPRNIPSRSRSPRPHRHHHPSSSPRRHRHRSTSDPHSHRDVEPLPSKSLPLGAQPISKRDLKTYKGLLGLYLDVQKQIVIEELGGREVKGRWRSFVGKWNRGELAEGWYDRATLERADGEVRDNGGRAELPTEHVDRESGRDRDRDMGTEVKGSKEVEESADEEDDYGPVLPKERGGGRGYGDGGQGKGQRSGPAIPRMEDLQMRDEILQDDRHDDQQDLRFDRKIDRKRQREQLDDIAPRAEAGTRERMLEKKKEKADSNRAFARRGSPGATEEVPENDLMGADEGIEGFKRVRREAERKKNERELRKEEVLRARVAEREERAREYRVREEKTMEGLRVLARERFG